MKTPNLNDAIQRSPFVVVVVVVVVGFA